MRYSEKLLRSLHKSCFCVGLDTDVEKIPPHLRSIPNGQLAFNESIIEATCDLAGAYKTNFAFYEALGSLGWDNLKATAAAIRSKAPQALLIADAKRGDIGNTSALYAWAVFAELGYDAITLSPYMGSDSVEPFLQDPDHGAFVLCLTSNPGSQDLQHFEGRDGKLYEVVIDRVHRWNTNGNCGLVVGATQTETMDEIRAQAKDLPFLIPGIGTQGGNLGDSVRLNWDGERVNAFINVSRRVIYAGDGEDFAEKAKAKAEEYVNEIDNIKKELKAKS